MNKLDIEKNRKFYLRREINWENTHAHTHTTNSNDCEHILQSTNKNQVTMSFLVRYSYNHNIQDIKNGEKRITEKVAKHGDKKLK